MKRPKRKPKAYYESRKPFTPDFGEIYENEGGGRYECIDREATHKRAMMQNVKTGWTFIAVRIGIYEDGKIDWDYQTDGAFKEKRVSV